MTLELIENILDLNRSTVKSVKIEDEKEREELLNYFKQVKNELDLANIHYLQLLDIFTNYSEFNYFSQEVSIQYISEYIDKLSKIGKIKKENELFKDSINNMGYRLMEQIRAGKRSDVFYSILRIYISCNLQFDNELLIAFKQKDDEMFKVLLFSFMSGILE